MCNNKFFLEFGAGTKIPSWFLDDDSSGLYCGNYFDIGGDYIFTLRYSRFILG